MPASVVGRAPFTEGSIVPNWQENFPIIYWQDSAHSLELRRLSLFRVGLLPNRRVRMMPSRG
jgi:hypothetical protein